MTKTYNLTMTHEFIIETNNIEEVVKKYQFPDFSNCESIVGEPEYLMGGNTWTELSETELEMI